MTRAGVYIYDVGNDLANELLTIRTTNKLKSRYIIYRPLSCL